MNSTGASGAFAGADATSESDILYCGAGNGAFTMQHDMFFAAARSVSPPFIFMCLQHDRVLAVEQSAILEDKSAQAETDACPIPDKLSANANRRVRRIDSHYSTPSCAAYQSGCDYAFPL